MNFTEGNHLQVALIREIDLGHHNAARTAFLDLHSQVVRRAMILLEQTMGQTPVVCPETVARLRAILERELGKDPQVIMQEMIDRVAA